MQTFNIFQILSLAAAFTTVSATAVTRCGLMVDPKLSGNIIAMEFTNVPDVSVSTICGHINSQLGEGGEAGHNSGILSSGFHINRIGGDPACVTSFVKGGSSTLKFIIGVDKQSPQQQLQAVINGVSNAFGSQGVNGRSGNALAVRDCTIDSRA